MTLTIGLRTTECTCPITVHWTIVWKLLLLCHVKMLCLFWVYYLVLYVKLGQGSLTTVALGKAQTSTKPQQSHLDSPIDSSKLRTSDYFLFIYSFFKRNASMLWIIKKSVEKCPFLQCQGRWGKKSWIRPCVMIPMSWKLMGSILGWDPSSIQVWWKSVS